MKPITVICAQAPDHVAIGIEIPVLLLEIGVPFYFDSPAVIAVRNDRADGLDRHARDSLVAGIERKPGPLGGGGFDGDAVVDTHGHYVIDKAVLIPVLPNAFFEEAFGLVGGVAVIPVRADQPVADAAPGPVLRFL